MRWNLFVSHIWSSAQDQAATIKRRLQLLVPDASIFLDVDDLEDIGALEENIEATQVVLTILSSGYFASRNCMREVYACHEQQKPLVLVHETDESKGGAPLDRLRSECAAEVRPYVFGSEASPSDVIPWHRISDFQLVSFKLIVGAMLRGCPGYMNITPRELFIPKEPSHLRLAFRSRVRLYVSDDNPGALGVAEVLQAGLDGRIELTPEPQDVPAQRYRSNVVRHTVTRGKQAARRSSVGDKLRSSTAATQATHFLLYLSSKTSSKAKGARLAKEVRRARSAALPVVMVHENDPASHGCAFGHFFSVTPHDLIESGLYRDLAVAYFPGAFRATSTALVARKLGAVSVGSWRRDGGFSTAGCASAAEAAALLATGSSRPSVEAQSLTTRMKAAKARVLAGRRPRGAARRRQRCRCHGRVRL